MKARISEKQLRRFYRLLSVPMIDFDCGQLCAPQNGGVPHCCENEYVVPILFREEYRWQRKKDSFWKPASKKKKEVREMVEESAEYYVFSSCPGPDNCKRSRRSMNCMTYPFEPHVNSRGEILGLVYTPNGQGNCALHGRPRRIYNSAYIENSITFWRELFEFYPEEKELYIEESRKRHRRERRKGRRVKLFR